MSEDYLIHPERLSSKPLVFEGTFAPADLERLADAVANGEGELRYRITRHPGQAASQGPVVYNRRLRFSHVPE